MLCAHVIAVSLLLSAGPPKFDPERTMAFFTWAPGYFCLAPDGKRLALDSWTVWDIAGRKPLVKGKTSGVHGMAISPDNRFLAVGGNYAELRVYDLETGKLEWDLTLKHGNSIIQHLEFTPDSRYLVSSCCNGFLRSWDVRKKKAGFLFCFPAVGWYAKDGHEDTLREWRRAAGPKNLPDDAELFVTYKQKIEDFNQFAIHPDGKVVAVPARAGGVLLIELATGKIAKTYATKHEGSHSVCYSRDGKTLAVGGGSGDRSGWKSTIELWNVSTGKRVRTMKGHKHTVLKMAFSPDGKTLASGGTVDGLRVWDTATGKQIRHIYGEDDSEYRVVNVAFMPDGKTLLALRGF
ncbi:MAG: hypothetical protein K2W96_17745, partial [Gemmataceae bacterium]|nr:hypothetical protein [Gemmataceae bacterium]